MTELDDGDSPEPARKRRLHGARCCTTTPPRLRWEDSIEAVVCDSCERVYAPIISAMNDVTRTALIRAICRENGCNTGMGRLLDMNRHAVRRNREKYKLEESIDYTIPYAEPGPTAADLAG